MQADPGQAGVQQAGVQQAGRVPGGRKLASVVRGSGWAKGVRARGARPGGVLGSSRAGGARGRSGRTGRSRAGEPDSQQSGPKTQRVGPGSQPGRPPLGEEPLGNPGLSLGLPAGLRSNAEKLARTAATRARRRPLEATAVVLLGLGGLIFPPVWLIGAAIALISRVWDFRDKWIGLALPIFLVIAGMGADVSLSSSQASLGAYFKEAWIFGGHISRIVAVLGAIYLAWRAERGRRPPAVPPWNKPHRFG